MTHHKEKELVEIGSLFEMPCQWSVGPIMEQFYAGFEKKKIFGIKCPECGKVYVPPRDTCDHCWTMMSKMVELPGKGQLVNYTVAHVDMRGKKREEPIVIGLIKIEGASTQMIGLIKGVKPDAVKLGMKLKAAWIDTPKGAVKDMHFEPV